MMVAAIAFSIMAQTRKSPKPVPLTDTSVGTKVAKDLGAIQYSRKVRAGGAAWRMGAPLRLRLPAPAEVVIRVGNEANRTLAFPATAEAASLIPGPGERPVAGAYARDATKANSEWTEPVGEGKWAVVHWRLTCIKEGSEVKLNLGDPSGGVWTFPSFHGDRFRLQLTFASDGEKGGTWRGRCKLSTRQISIVDL